MGGFQPNFSSMASPEAFSAMGGADRSAQATSLSSSLQGANIPGITTPGQTSPGDYAAALQQAAPQMPGFSPFGNSAGGGAIAPYGMNSNGVPFQNAAPGFNAGANAQNMPGSPMGGKAGGNAQPDARYQAMQSYLQGPQEGLPLSRAGQGGGGQSPMSGKASPGGGSGGGGKQGQPSQSSFQGSPFGGGRAGFSDTMQSQMMPAAPNFNFQPNPMNPGGGGGGTPSLQGYLGAQAGALGNPNQGGYNGVGRSEMATPGLSAFGQMAGGIGTALGGMTGGGSTFGSGTGTPSPASLPNASSQVFR